MSVSGIGGLAYQIFVDFLTKREVATCEQNQIDRLERAMVLELRVLLNLVKLAERADRVNDKKGRDVLLSQLSYPLLSAVAMGLSGSTLSKDRVDTILNDLKEQMSRGEEDEDNEVSDLASRDVIDRISLMVSRLSTVQALSRMGDSELQVRWGQRLERLRNDIFGVLRAVLESIHDRQD